MENIPISEKFALTIKEAAAYFGIGERKLREMVSEDGCPFALLNGSKRLIKRRALESYLSSAHVI